MLVKYEWENHWKYFIVQSSSHCYIWLCAVDGHTWRFITDRKAGHFPFSLHNWYLWTTQWESIHLNEIELKQKPVLNLAWNSYASFSTQQLHDHILHVIFCYLPSDSIVSILNKLFISFPFTLFMVKFIYGSSEKLCQPNYIIH
jgi:hypothetical protein